MASRKNPDDPVPFITATPGLLGLELVVGRGTKRNWVIRNAQPELVYEEHEPSIVLSSFLNQDPPEPPGLLSCPQASLASLSAQVRAGPVGFIR